MRELVTEMKTACSEVLQTLGFRRTAGPYVRDTNEEVFVGVGLPTVVRGREGYIEVDATVIATHVPLEELLCRLQGLSAPTRYKSQTTILRNLGYLTPRKRYTAYHFDSSTDVGAVAAQIARDVEDFGKPFFNDHETLFGFYESMQTRRYGGMGDSFAWRKPVAAILLGMPETARMHIADHLDRIREETPGFVDRYRNFAKAVDAYLTEQQEPSKHAPES